MIVKRVINKCFGTLLAHKPSTISFNHNACNFNTKEAVMSNGTIGRSVGAALTTTF